MAATVAGILLVGDHASRPAFGDVVAGTLYSCTTHDLVYQSDGATAWSTWADLTGASLDFGESGDIGVETIGASAAAGSTGEVADAGHVHAFPSAATITAALDFGESGDIGASAPGDAAAAGATGEVADAGHKHPRLTERVVYEFVIDGGGSTITTGIKGDLYVPDAFTLTGWVILLDQSGSIVIDVWNDTYANYPPTNADSLNAGGGTKPTVTTATKNKDTTLTSYDTSIAADSTLRFNVDSVTSATRAVIALFGYRT